jgi:hypothetical protein
VLTVNGKAAMVIQDADSYQKEVEELARLATENGIPVKLPGFSAG